jgi:hypothetical protein
MRLWTADGSMVEMATAGAARSELVGMLPAAAISAYRGRRVRRPRELIRRRTTMSETQQRTEYANEPYKDPVTPRATGWVGMVVFAGVMLLLLGGFQAIEGIVAIFRDQYYLTTSAGLVLTVDYTAWGWTHLLLGAIAILAGLGVLGGQTWARVVGIIIAVVSALANMMFLAAYPVWGTIVIAIDVLVIYALAAHGREVHYR